MRPLLINPEAARLAAKHLAPAAGAGNSEALATVAAMLNAIADADEKNEATRVVADPTSQAKATDAPAPRRFSVRGFRLIFLHEFCETEINAETEEEAIEAVKEMAGDLEWFQDERVEGEKPDFTAEEI